MSKSRDYILGLLSGAAIGSVLALLYAPDKGSNLRDRLSYQLNSYLEELTDVIERLNREQATISDAKKKGDLVVEDAKERAEALIHEAEDLLSAINKAKEEQ